MPNRIKRGDAEAVLNAFGTGGTVILRRAGERGEGSPADELGSHGSIRPFGGSPWDGRHYCAEDWHVILVGWVDGGDASFDHQQARAAFDPVEISFMLDGAALATTRTPIKPFNGAERFEVERAWYFQQGKVMAPDDLGTGQHELSVRITDPTGVFDDSITFFVDAAGTGACLS